MGKYVDLTTFGAFMILSLKKAQVQSDGPPLTCEW